MHWINAFRFFCLHSTDCYSQPVSALHSHISMCKFDLFLGKYHQTEFCFWACSPSKGTRSFSSQEWFGRAPPTVVMSMTTMQCGNDGSGCQSSGNHSSFWKEEAGILEKLWEQVEWWSSSTPFLEEGLGNSEMSLGVRLTDVHDLQMGSSHQEKQSTVRVPEGCTDAAFS